MTTHIHNGDSTTSGGCDSCCTKLNNLTVRLDGATVLDHVNLHLHCGELVALVGPNGAGKTTLLRAILGELEHEGTIDFVGTDGGRRLRIGYVPQRMDFDRQAPFSVLDLFAAANSRRPVFWGAGGRSRAAAQTALSLAGVADLLDQPLGNLSGGQLQRVMLALALTPVPNLLLLDEPLTGMDQAGIDLFYHTVAELRTIHDLSILMVSHDLPMVAHIANRMVFLDHTIVCDDVPGVVLDHPQVRMVFGAHGILPSYGAAFPSEPAQYAHHAREAEKGVRLKHGNLA